MIFEQFADEIITYQGVPQRVLRSDISCGLSARIRTAFFVVALYLYGMLFISIPTTHITLARVVRKFD